jgi:hypothetical protein
MDVIKCAVRNPRVHPARRRSFLFFMPVVALICMAAHCPSTTPIPAPRPGAWLVFLCKASDVSTEPFAAPFFKQLFDSNQRDWLYDYFTEVSFGKADVSGTEVYGWFPMGTTAFAMSPARRNNTTVPNRGQTLEDCKGAGAAWLLASGKTIDFSKYVGVIAIINVPVDNGQTGQGLTANVNDVLTFYEHEMLHVYGLPHSFIMTRDLEWDHTWHAGTDTQYGDCWDIMSFISCTYRFNSGLHQDDGPELEMAYRNKLGWAPAVRLIQKSSQDTTPLTVTLAPVSEPAQQGYLMATFHMPGVGDYVIEYRVPTGFDRALPQSAVVIREWRDGITALINRKDGRIGFSQNDTFMDVANDLTIHVESTEAHSATITLQPHYTVPSKVGKH